MATEYVNVTNLDKVNIIQLTQIGAGGNGNESKSSYFFHLSLGEVLNRFVKSLFYRGGN